MKTQNEKKQVSAPEMGYEEIKSHLEITQPEWSKLSHAIGQAWANQEIREIQLFSMLGLAIGQIGEERCKEWNERILPLYIKQNEKN